jgi:hypothetical protein
MWYLPFRVNKILANIHVINDYITDQFRLERYARKVLSINSQVRTNQEVFDAIRGDEANPLIRFDDMLDSRPKSPER